MDDKMPIASAENARRPRTDTAGTKDYSSWPVDRLVQRVNELEAQLAKATSRYTTNDRPNDNHLAIGTHTQKQTGHTSHLPTRSKHVKSSKKSIQDTPRPFDPSRYSTRLIALKFAYLGQRYNGYEHHTNNRTPLPTIEEELWKALVKTRLIFPTPVDGIKEGDVNWEGCDYSKCGRTDRGVSAFGQVVGVRVRSARPLDRPASCEPQDSIDDKADQDEQQSDQTPELTPPFDPIRDELPYIQLLNKVLPKDIRVYAWCPSPPDDFSARFACKQRMYKYLFTLPAFYSYHAPSTNPASAHTNDSPSTDTANGPGWLDISAMQAAAKRFEGLHDFRNFCKVDPAKQITNFCRCIYHASVERVESAHEPMACFTPFTTHDPGTPSSGSPTLYTFTVAGSAFLWHQVRHMVAVVFLAGQGLEKPSIVSDLLDVDKISSRPVYEMASDAPLVLWDCRFDDETTEGLDWVYLGDEANTASSMTPDPKYGRGGLMEDLWTLWRQRKMEEVLAGSLANIVSSRGHSLTSPKESTSQNPDKVRLFEGNNLPRPVGKYIPILKKERIEHHEVLNARYAKRKGLVEKSGATASAYDE